VANHIITVHLYRWIKSDWRWDKYKALV